MRSTSASALKRSGASPLRNNRNHTPAAAPLPRRGGHSEKEKAMLKDRYKDGVVQRRVDHVRVGDLIDLQNDPYADSQGAETSETAIPESPFEFAVVESVERETPQCTVLHTSQGSFGFPPDHWLDVDGEQLR
jgi:hypothetical protein